MHYHDLIKVRETDSGLYEVCRECKAKVVTRKKKDGNFNSGEYREKHLRDFAQPTGRTAKIFKKYYEGNNHKRI